MKRQWKLFVSALTLATFAAFAVTPTSRAMAQDDQGGSVVGTWTGTALLAGIPLTELANINLDGTMAGVDGIYDFCQIPTVPSALVVKASGYFGSWAHVGNSDEIALTFKRLLFACPNTPTSLYGTFFPGQNIGLGTIEVLLTLQHNTRCGDSLTGRYTYQLTTLDGRLVPGGISNGSIGGGSVSLCRVEIEPLATP